jgi:hypothetical protein
VKFVFFPPVFDFIEKIFSRNQLEISNLHLPSEKFENKTAQNHFSTPYIIEMSSRSAIRCADIAAIVGSDQLGVAVQLVFAGRYTEARAKTKKPAKSPSNGAQTAVSGNRTVT